MWHLKYMWPWQWKLLFFKLWRYIAYIESLNVLDDPAASIVMVVFKCQYAVASLCAYGASHSALRSVPLVEPPTRRRTVFN
jgi:hypothetical protein